MSDCKTNQVCGTAGLVPPCAWTPDNKIDQVHDPAGNLKETDTNDEGTAADERDYTYDYRNRLVKVEDATGRDKGGIAYYLTHQDHVERRMEPGLPGTLTGHLWPWHDLYGKTIPGIQGPNGPLMGTQRILSRRVFRGHESVNVWERWTLHLNPDRDFLPERSEKWTAKGDEPWVPEADREALLAVQTSPDPLEIAPPGKTTTTIVTYAQTPTGHWFPRKKLIETEHPDGKVTKAVEIIHLDTEREIPDEVLDWRQFEATLQRPIKQQ